jgi:GNAT superfamily N-acetyltransferase
LGVENEGLTMLSISPISITDLHAVAALAVDEPELINRLRWHMRTPYAYAVKAEHEGVLAGVAFGIAHAGSGMMHELFVYPTYMDMGIGSTLGATLLGWMEERCCLAQFVVARPGTEGFWERLGFVPQVELLRYEGGRFDSASRSEVVALEPPHLLAIARLDRMVTGEDRSHWLREYADIGSVFLECTLVRGFLLPLPGRGLIVADNPEVGLELQRWLLPVQEELIMPVGNMAAHAHLVHRKYRVHQAGLRMVRGAYHRFRPEMVFAHP